MRHKKNRGKLNRSSAHRDAMMMNLAVELIQHGRIKTTLPKAKALRPYVEKLVTRARKGDLHSRRVLLSKLWCNDRASSRKAGGSTAVEKLISDIAPRMQGRPGGYTRIVKIGPRQGDAAPMAFIEWVDHQPKPKAAKFGAAGSGAHAHTHDHEHQAVAAG